MSSAVDRSALNRRGFLGRTALAGVGIAFAGSLDALVRPGTATAAPGAIGYGPLVPDPHGILALPIGFSYTVLAKSGETLLDDGYPVPSDPDAHGVFARGSGATVVSNHEVGGATNRSASPSSTASPTTRVPAAAPPRSSLDRGSVQAST